MQDHPICDHPMSDNPMPDVPMGVQAEKIAQLENWDNHTREDRDAPTRDDWVVTPGAGYLRRYQDHCLCRTAEEQTIVTEMSRVNSMTIAEIIKILEVAENSDPSGSSAT